MVYVLGRVGLVAHLVYAIRVMVYCPLPDGAFTITQGFGVNPEMYKKFGYLAHNGIDFSPQFPGRRNVIIYAPHEGYVTLGDEGSQGYGKYVQILGQPYNYEGKRRKSYLAHLDKFIVRDGQFVGSGDPIGYMGNTGFSTGYHLHWTYKLADREGNTLNKDNGYGGGIAIGKSTLRWWLNTLVQH